MSATPILGAMRLRVCPAPILASSGKYIYFLQELSIRRFHTSEPFIRSSLVRNCPQKVRIPSRKLPQTRRISDMPKRQANGDPQPLNDVGKPEKANVWSSPGAAAFDFRSKFPSPLPIVEKALLMRCR